MIDSLYINRLKSLLVMAQIFWAMASFAQEMKQAVKGSVVDQISGAPIPGLTLQLLRNGSSMEATTDEAGNFSIQTSVGRYILKGTGTLYRIPEQEIVVISGHALQLRLRATLITQVLPGVEVSTSSTLESPGTVRSLSIEKTLRFPANFFDPVRVATAYPGVVAANDQANSIIVRGNSSNGLLWRLNGLDIVNPNHLANAGTLSDIPVSNGGGVNILSAQMLDKTDFYVGAFPANYGNALSGVVDMKLREGSTSEMQYTAQASLIGLDFATEGPVGKNNSFVANYRYSTVGLLSAAGVNFGDEAISFQDLSLHWMSDFKKGGKLSLFGLWGASVNELDAKPFAEWEEDKDKYNIDYSSDTYAVGLNYTITIGRGELLVGAAYSSVEQLRKLDPSSEVPNTLHILGEEYESDRSIFSSNIRYSLKLSDKTTWETGVMTNYMKTDMAQSRTVGCQSCLILSFQSGAANEGLLMQPFTEISTAISRKISLDAGVRYLQYTYNSSNSFEPRASLHFKPASSTRVDLSYSLMSKLQEPLVYAIDRNLGFTKSHDIDLSLRKSLNETLTLTTGLFYQSLFNVPVSDLQPAFSTINLMEDFPPPGLENKGTGKNYGIDATVEKLFYHQQFFLFGGSFYQSKYKGADGLERDSRWNGNYTINATYGREWIKTEKNRSIVLSSRLLYLGGLRESSIDLPATQFLVQTVYDRTDPYNNKLNDYFRLDLRVSFRKNKQKYTRTFAIDIQNLTSQQNEAFHYYDFTQQKIVTKFQLGIIPILVYRIDF